MYNTEDSNMGCIKPKGAGEEACGFLSERYSKKRDFQRIESI